MERLSYFIRRLLLVIPTFLGITFLVFALIQFVPGGPVEQRIAQMRGMGSGEAGGGNASSVSISEDQRRAIEREFGFDKPFLVRYGVWLFRDLMGMRSYSYKYNNKTVWQLIVERFPISLTFGVSGFVLTYLICVPLGIVKALRNGGTFDLVSSIVVLVLYAIPAFAFGMILKTLFSGTSDQFYDIFPIGGFRSENWASLTMWGKVKDQTHHMFLPVLCYVIGNFAILTILMKNSLLDQIAQDYVRTVLAKGGTMRRAIWLHALRNALIPIVTGIGGILSIMFAGSVLIERVFSINGIGLLTLDAIVGRDYMIFMGTLALTAIVGLLGRILSDFCYVLVDPRINFGKEA
ncbi:MAG: ABC transporter permease subunit [Verrucomicrobiales bacterium]|jgi:microcin C transport system permease protein|nr:ABC transporter permease subunit [Verrucomicrobiales bacterium]HQZ26730.1 ABC transporter permease subunit [Verrucomicrobiales bacterium]